MDNTEGTLICTECGTVQETNLSWCDIHTYKNHDDFVKKGTNDLINIDRSSGFDNNTIHESYYNEAHALMNSLGRKYRGMNRKGVYANCLYNICISYNSPRSLKEISEILCVDLETINKTRKYLQPNNSKRHDCIHDDANFMKMIPRYLEKIETYIPSTPNSKRKMTNQICDWMKDDSLLCGRTPHTRIVTFLYYLLIQNEHQRVPIEIEKKDVCVQFYISIVTLNKSYKQLLHDFSNL